MKILGPVLLNILLVLVLCAVFCLFVKVRLHVTFSKHQGEQLRYETAWSLFGGKFKKTFKFGGGRKTKKKSGKKSAEKKDKQELTFTQKLEWLKCTLDRIRIIQSKSSSMVKSSVFFRKIHLKIRFGTDDAFATGTLTGLVWAVLYNLVAVLSRFFRISEPEFEITPIYDEEIFDGEGECIVSFRLVNIISALVCIGFNYLKTKPKHSQEK